MYTDVYDAITSHRPYRRAKEPFEAIEYIMANAGEAFDPELVDVFVKKIAPYPIGTCVQLSNGVTAIVVENHEGNCLRPTVRSIDEKPAVIYDLFNDRSLLGVTITSTVEM